MSDAEVEKKEKKEKKERKEKKEDGEKKEKKERKHKEHKKDGEKKERKERRHREKKDGEKKEKKHRKRENGEKKERKKSKEERKEKKEKKEKKEEGSNDKDFMSNGPGTKDRSTELLSKYYELGKQLGSGAFSIVCEGKNIETGEQVAIKCIKKSVVQGDDIILLKREVTNLRGLDHSNILKLYEVFEDNDQFFLVMELVKGKELFDKIIERGNYSEKDASNITKQVLSAIAYLHSKGIAHRDLKPENILSAGEGENEVIKVADFGLSKNFGEDKLQTSCGSPGYVAPEVLMSDSYGEAVDMWSIGVILYILLCGYPPFYADTDPALFKKIMEVDYDFEGEGWDDISEGAKDLIRRLLVKDPKQRYTAPQALEHPWIKASGQLSNKALQMNKLKDYQSRRKM